MKARRVAMLVITSDRGMNGAYSANAIKTAARLRERPGARGGRGRPPGMRWGVRRSPT
ncbi:MAG: hypothetical protein R2742_03875 [Micropruina glycogenica]